MKNAITVTAFGQATASPDRASTPAGYRARNILRIELDDIGRVGEILRVGLDTIGDGAEMNGINFALRDNATVAATARERAYEGAVAKASQLAVLAGRGLGQAISIFETEGWALPKMMARMEAPDLAFPVEAGTTV